jgi:hypothetical protein
MTKGTIYIAGPMRGRPNWNYDAFSKAERDLKAVGWSVVNPATLDENYEDTKGLGKPEDFDPNTNGYHKDVNRRIMRRDVTVICDRCDAIYMLEGWETSRGACAEFYLSSAIGLDIYYEGSHNVFHW